MSSRIPIHVSNHTAFVWDVDRAPKTIVHSNVLADKHLDFYADVATLRSAHRICGVLSGTLPNLTQQNVFLGLPLVLMPEEFVLLVEKRASSLVFHTTTPID